MTLNVSLLTPGYIIQASDRRMVREGKPVDDDANKGIVLRADDGTFAITFTGIGIAGQQRVDVWLSERMADEGLPELPIEEGVRGMAQLATDWFATFPKAWDKRHTFVIAGWNTLESRPRPPIWSVSNCYGAAGGMLDTAKEVFDVRRHRVHSSFASVYGFGLHQAIGRSDWRRLKAALRKTAAVDRAEQAAVELIRSAAAKPEWKRYINGEILVIAVDSNGQARSTYYPTTDSASNYAPLFVWYEGGRNFMAGDAWALPTRDCVYEFGTGMLLATRGGVHDGPTLPPAPQQKIEFLFRFSAAKHKADPPADIPIIKARQVTQL